MPNVNQINAVSAVVSYETDNGEQVTLSPEIVKSYLVNGNNSISEQEIYMFINLCKYQHLNPFLREAYLIKYSDKKPAQIVCGKELFTKRAEKHKDFDGYEAGIIVLTSDKKLQNRPGTTYLKNHGDELIGGWARVYRKNCKVAFESTAMLEEYRGVQYSLWDSKPATMIRKVALVQALREAFPDMYGGLYSQEEINTVNERDLPETEVMVDKNEKKAESVTEKYECEECGKAFKDKVCKGITYTAADLYAMSIRETGRAICYDCYEAKKRETAAKDISEIITMEQCKRLFAVAGKGKENIVRDVLSKHGYESSKLVKKTDYEAICNEIQESVNAADLYEYAKEKYGDRFIKKETGSIVNAVTGEVIDSESLLGRIIDDGFSEQEDAEELDGKLPRETGDSSSDIPA